MKASVFPDAVPVVTTRCSPRAAASQAARWWSVERVDADRVAHARVELVRERCGSRVARGLLGAVGELLAAEQLVGQNDGAVRSPFADASLAAPGCPDRG